MFHAVGTRGRASIFLALAAGLSGAMAAPAGAQTAPLIPREVLFGNPERSEVRLSPDGAQMSWVAPDDGVLNIWIAPSHDPAAGRPLTRDRGRGVSGYYWAANGEQILYEQDDNGDEISHVFAVDVATGETRDLTPFGDARAEIQAISWQHPDEILVLSNRRDPSRFDVLRVDVTDGRRTLAYENAAGYRAFLYDNDLQVRLAGRPGPNATMVIAALEDGGERELVSFPFGVNFEPLHFDADNTHLYARDARGRDTAALARIDVASGDLEVIAASDRADIGEFLKHPTSYAPQAYTETYLTSEWVVIDEAVADDLAFLEERLDGEIHVVDRTRADDRWMVLAVRGHAPPTYYVYDRAAREIAAAFPTRPEWDGYEGARVHPVEIAARDGLVLPSYLILPPGSDSDGDGRPDRPLPTVNLVHGGPNARWPYGFLARGQWLANRGYAVLLVNFRGSTGFGTAFTRAGDRGWGAQMQDDLSDAVAWAIEQGVAAPDEIAIMGGSYGGYATLAGLAFTPETYACGVDMAGPANLVTLLTPAEPSPRSNMEATALLIGDPRTEEGRALLAERSPVHAAGNITRPLLIVQGGNDPRVPKAEADQMVAAMTGRGLPVTYLVFPDEGHGLVRPENNLAFYAAAESFLADCLGGRAEPAGDAFADSSILVPEGAEHVPALAGALDSSPRVSGRGE